MLERKRTVHFHSHRADDLMTAVRLAEEFGFELVLQHATEGYRIADELAKRKMPVSLTLVDSPGGKLETAGLLEENAAILDKAGVKVAINTDDFITESRFFLRTGAIAVRGGMSEDAALKALTLNPGADAAPGRPHSARWRRARTPISWSCPGRRSASTRRCWRRTSTACRSSTARRARTGPTRPAASPWPTRRGCRKPPAPVKPPPTAAGSGARRGRPSRRNAGRSAIAILAGRIHTVGSGTITDGVDPGRGRQDHGGRPRRATSSCPPDCRSLDRRRRHAGPDRRPHLRRPVRGAATSRPTRTRTR